MNKIIDFRGLHFRDLIGHFALKSLWQQCFFQHPVFWALSMWIELRLPSMTVMWEQLPFSSWLWHGAAVRRSMPWLAPGHCAIFLLLQGSQTKLAGGLISLCLWGAEENVCTVFFCMKCNRKRIIFMKKCSVSFPGFGNTCIYDFCIKRLGS